MDIDPSIIDAIDKNNASLMGRSHAPGMIFGIVKNGEPAFLERYGDARLNPAEPVTPDTIFRIASVSKIFTAIGVMQLVEQGQVKLDDPVEKHLKSFKIRKAHPNDPEITIRHLLTHTAGVGEFAPILGYFPPNTFFGVGRKGSSLPPLSNLYRGELRPDRSPGTAWAYANHGFATLGQMIADVTRISFPEAMRQMIFRPLGMENSDFVRSERVQQNKAVGYWKLFGSIRPVIDVDILTLADGSLFTNAQDFSKFLGAITLGGKGLISKPNLDQMLKPHYQQDEHLPAMGLGFMLESQKLWYGHPVAIHTGLWLGFHSAMLLAPDQQMGVFAFVNDGGDVGISAAKNGMRRLLATGGQRVRFDRPQPDPTIWGELVGEYETLPGFNSNFRLWLTYRSTFTVYVENDKLMIRSQKGPWQKGELLRPADNDNPLVFLVNNQYIVFQRNDQGVVNRFGMRYFEMFKQ